MLGCLVACSQQNSAALLLFELADSLNAGRRDTARLREGRVLLLCAVREQP